MTLPNRKLRWGVLGYARTASETLIPAILRSAFRVLCARVARVSPKVPDTFFENAGVIDQLFAAMAAK
jgi:hypothetical protein